MIRKVLSALIFSACAFAACSREATIYGKCNDTFDCHTEWNDIPGSECVDGLCKCVNPDFEHCCFRSQDENCTLEDNYRCRPKEECDPMAPFIFPDAGADASDGG